MPLLAVLALCAALTVPARGDDDENAHHLAGHDFDVNGNPIVPGTRTTSPLSADPYVRPARRGFRSRSVPGRFAAEAGAGGSGGGGGGGGGSKKDGCWGGGGGGSGNSETGGSTASATPASSSFVIGGPGLWLAAVVAARALRRRPKRRRR